MEPAKYHSRFFGRLSTFAAVNLRRAGIIVTILIVVALVILNRRDLTLVKQDGFALGPIGSEGYELQSVITLKNPNLLSSTIQSIDQKFYLNDSLVCILHNQLEQGIPGLKETSLPVMARFTDAIFRRDSALDNRVIPVHVMGSIKYRNFTGEGSIEVNVVDTIFLN